MGCNCGKKSQQFKELVRQKAVPTPNPAPMTRAERIRLRAIRIAARNARIAARNAEAEKKRQLNKQ